MSATAKLDQALANAESYYRAGYLAQAEIICRRVLAKRSDDPVALNLLGMLSRHLGMRDHAIHYFRDALRSDPNFKTAAKNLAKAQSEERPHGYGGTKHMDRFVLIKAWGYGFFSDVSHVLGALLLAELTDRTPVVHWGKTSLFSDGTGADAFTRFFNEVSDKSIEQLLHYPDGSYFPPKWTSRNLRSENINKWKGNYSRMAGLYFLNRAEEVIVSDFYISVTELLPWIPTSHPLHGLSIEELLRYLIKKYLTPKQYVLDEIDEFFERHLADGPFIAVHIRGSDKLREQKLLAQINQSYFGKIDDLIDNNSHRIFVLTDDTRLLSSIISMYGDRVIYTQCQRTASDVGVHYQQLSQGRVRIGVEVMKDVYLAARANWFVGNGQTNPSCMIAYMKEWDPGTCILLSPNLHHIRNAYIHFNGLDTSHRTSFAPMPSPS